MAAGIASALKTKGVRPPSRKGIPSPHIREIQKLAHTPAAIAKRSESIKRFYDLKGRKHDQFSRDLIKRTKRYKDWRRAVFERDNYTCQDCGRRGGYLEADHIKPWAYFPDLRFSIDNGRTLCKPCHRNTDTYGTRAKAKYGSLVSTPACNGERFDGW
jgi:hypothetical protein